MADFAAVVRRYMGEREMSLRALGRASGYDAGYLSRVLGGHKPPTPYLATILDEALTAGGAIIAAAAGNPSARTIGDAEKIRQGLDDTLGVGTMSEAALADWDRTVASYGRATRDRAAVILLEDLTADLGELNRTIGRHRSASGLRGLTRAAAQMSGLVCLTLIKTGDRQAYRRWGRTARLAASEAGDKIICSWVVAEEAYGYYYDGDLPGAIDTAQHAQELAAGMPCVGAALAAALEMRAHAAMGSDMLTRAALDRAEVILGELDGNDLDASAFGYNEAQLRFHEGSAFTQLGDTRAALAAQDRALELCAPGDYMDWALIRLDRAVCLLLDGDVKGALQVAADTIKSVTPPQRVGIISTRVHELLSALDGAGHNAAHVGELRELLLLTTVTEEAASP